jgi:hypothetical protein
MERYTLDNFALMPASLIPLRDHWERLVSELPAGDVLMIVPVGPSKLRRILQTLSPTLRSRGRRITTLNTPLIDQAGPREWTS